MQHSLIVLLAIGVMIGYPVYNQESIFLMKNTMVNYSLQNCFMIKGKINDDIY